MIEDKGAVNMIEAPFKNLFTHLSQKIFAQTKVKRMLKATQSTYI